jgi:ATP-dependent DNA ligase
LRSPIPSPASLADTFASADLCHPTLWRQAFAAEGWLFELKHDGFRAFARKSGLDVDLLSRWGRSMAHAFPEVIDTLLAVPADVVLDAELVVADEQGRSDFEELAASRATATSPVDRGSSEAYAREVTRLRRVVRGRR